MKITTSLISSTLKHRLFSAAAFALVVVTFIGCSENIGVETDTDFAPRTTENDAAQFSGVSGELITTPSGAVFSPQEWAQIEDKRAYNESAEDIVARIMNAPKVAGKSSFSLLCHSYAGICAQIVALYPGANLTYWNDSQWTAASVADFAQFDMIYIHDGAGSASGIINSKDVWGLATTGRVALTGVHFEHCSAISSPNSGPCRVLNASTEWITNGDGTGLLMSTQYVSGAVMPTVAPYGGVTFSQNGLGFDNVRITDPGHATMQGSTDASLSNFGQSAHSIFGSIGGFTSVADVCTTYSRNPNPCTGTFLPHFLVTSVGVADQDGDGFDNENDNCSTVSNPGQEDANGNGIGDVCESAPTVTITPATSVITAGGSVSFTTTATDSDDPLSSLTYEWRVNGLVQSGATGSTFTAVFSADATVRVTVRDPGNLSGFDEAEVTIISNQPPVADAGADDSVVAGSGATLDGSASSDPDGDTLTYEWTEGGNVLGNTASLAVGPFTAVGTHTYTLTVDDGNGESDSDTVSIVVTNDPPVAEAGPTQVGIAGQNFTLDASASSDPNGHVLSFLWSTGSVTATTQSGALNTGTHTFNVTVDDGFGGTDSDEVSIEVSDIPVSVEVKPGKSKKSLKVKSSKSEKSSKEDSDSKSKKASKSKKDPKSAKSDKSNDGKGVVPVVIYTTDSFDATTVDPLTVAFGPSGAFEAHGKGHIEDVNGDGRPDMMLHFTLSETGLMAGDLEACLVGQTLSGFNFSGCAEVTVK
ncbi:hypothetical protein HQ496_00400 [bacterium]|nr:hypothetical protein [bacterium]